MLLIFDDLATVARATSLPSSVLVNAPVFIFMVVFVGAIDCGCFNGAPTCTHDITSFACSGLPSPV
jgi:hypothetical protein